MGLVSNESSSDQSVFYDHIMILDVDNISGTPAREGWQPNDCALNIKFTRLDDQGKILEPDSEPWSMFCQGNFQRNQQGKITDWGGAFKVRTFLEACGLKGTFTDDDGNLDIKVVNNAINKKVFKVSYKSTDINEDGKNKIKSWSGRFFSNTALAEKAWNKSVASGWPKDFIGLPGNETFQGRTNETVAETTFPTDI